MSTDPIRFGINNHVENSLVTSVPDPVTSLDYIKNDFRSRQTRFTDLTNPVIEIEGLLDSPQLMEYFALPGTNLGVNSMVKLELFADDTSTTDLLMMDYESIAQPIPLGIWSSGEDPYGDSSRISLSNIFIKWFDSAITAQRWKLSIQHGFTSATPVTNTTPRQDDVTGIVSLAASTGTIDGNGTNGDNTWAISAGLGENGEDIAFKSGTTFTWDPTAGPRIGYTFTAAQTGPVDLWVKINPSNDSNSVYTIFDGSITTNIVTATNTWGWHKLRTVNLTAEQDHELIFSARDFFYYLDRIVLQPTSEPDPTGTGPADSGFGTLTSNDNVSVRSLMIGEKMEMQKNIAYGNELRFMTEPDLEETASGYSVATRSQNIGRKFKAILQEASEADFTSMTEMEITLAGRAFIVSAYPNTNEHKEEAYTMLGRFASAIKYVHVFEDIYEIPLDIAEV